MKNTGVQNAGLENLGPNGRGGKGMDRKTRDQICRGGNRRTGKHGTISREIIVEIFQPMITVPERNGLTDGQTDDILWHHRAVGNNVFFVRHFDRSFCSSRYHVTAEVFISSNYSTQTPSNMASEWNSTTKSPFQLRRQCGPDFIGIGPILVSRHGKIQQ